MMCETYIFSMVGIVFPNLFWQNDRTFYCFPKPCFDFLTLHWDLHGGLNAA